MNAKTGTGTGTRRAAACALLAGCGTPAEARVLIVGIDGLRPDALEVADTPNFDTLLADGSVDWRSAVDFTTWSGPGWSSMLTGVNMTAALLRDADPDVVFADFDEADAQGHNCCVSPTNQNYIDKIVETDGKLGIILGALRSRPNYARENWLVLMTTDHGGTDIHRGQDIELHRTTWFLTSGAASAALVQGSTRVTDLAVTALAHLGVPVDPAWQLDGIAVGLKNAPAMTRRESRNTCEAESTAATVSVIPAKAGIQYAPLIPDAHGYAGDKHSEMRS